LHAFAGSGTALLYSAGEATSQAQTKPWKIALELRQMNESQEPDDRPTRVPPHIIETVNKLVRTSRQMLPEIGREPTPEELAAKLAMPVEKVRKLLAIARQPIRLDTSIG
jgi:Sigma-70 region 3